jgi:hypothetical protein
MGLQAAVHLGHMPWALTKEEEHHKYKLGNRNELQISGFFSDKQMEITKFIF